MTPPRLRLALAAALTLLGGPLRSAETTIEQWDTLTLDFPGPEASETGELNPFTDIRLEVTFTHMDTRVTVPGFYAADGRAATTGATAGNTWRVHFTPGEVGAWTWSATLHQGRDAVLIDDPASIALEPLQLPSSAGAFTVVPSTATGRDFRAHGRLTVDPATGYFHFPATGRLWLKGGADSPENLLGYQDFDDTYRHSEEFREGENRPNENLHTYVPHLGDWQPGDPTWRDGRGKGLIGALNYLAGTGMNAVYFLTNNIDGDGKDVWPYLTHQDRDRFDCSRLDQWEIVFTHMQRRGLALHVVTQETENELLLDAGFTGRERRLYYRELLARFGHHLALIWNLGEENGPADFIRWGQTPEQQRAMASWFEQHDPYGHPVVIHTHAWDGEKQHGLPPLFNHRPLDGASFQVDDRTTVHDAILHWKARARAAGQEWLISMDEIGMWHTGAVPDAVDPTHDVLRHHVLWGAFMAQAAGVEWYFGANYEHNDLSAEDWRSRANLWALTRHALDFFVRLPLRAMTPADDLTPRPDDYVLACPGTTYAIYLPVATAGAAIDLGRGGESYTVRWFDPRHGGELQHGSLPTVTARGLTELGSPPDHPEADWAVLLQRR